MCAAPDLVGWWFCGGMQPRLRVRSTKGVWGGAHPEVQRVFGVFAGSTGVRGVRTHDALGGPKAISLGFLPVCRTGHRRPSAGFPSFSRSGRLAKIRVRNSETTGSGFRCPRIGQIGRVETPGRLCRRAAIRSCRRQSKGQKPPCASAEQDVACRYWRLGQRRSSGSASSPVVRVR